MNYNEKLKHPKWQKKRLEVLQKDNFKCTLCDDEETELHVHHLVYKNNPWDSKLNELQTLCKDCHYLKTFEEPECDDIFIKAKKVNDSIIVTSKKNNTYLFHKIESKYVFYVRFLYKSIVLKELFELNNKDINNG